MDYRTGLPGPTPEPLREVAVINFACCQLFLDFVFVNIRSGLNVSFICGWKQCILLHVLTNGFIIHPCVRVHSNNTLQHETLNHSKQYTFADLNKMLFLLLEVISIIDNFKLGLPFYGSDEGQVGLEKPALFKVGNYRKSLRTARRVTRRPLLPGDRKSVVS